jgi:hypothetical protein
MTVHWKQKEKKCLYLCFNLKSKQVKDTQPPYNSQATGAIHEVKGQILVRKPELLCYAHIS